MALKGKTRWFIHPENTHTSDRVAETLGPAATMDEKIIHHKGKEKKIRVWEVEDHSFVVYMEKSRFDAHYKFKVYRQKEGQDYLEEFPFDRIGRLARTKKVKRMKEKLAKIRNVAA